MRIYPVNRPLCAIIGAFIGGLWLGSLPTFGWAGCAFFVLAASTALVLGWHSRKAPLVLACILALAGGLLYMQHETTAAQSLIPRHGEEVTLSATVTRAPADRTYVDARVTAIDGEPLAKAVPVRIQRAWEDTSDYEPRAVYTFSGSLRAPETARNPGGYDEARILSQRGTYSVFEAEAPGQEITPLSGWAASLAALQTTYHEILARHLDPGEEALVAATLFGDVSDLNEDFYTVSQQFGIIHIFSVSGLHVSFILAFVLVLARLLRRQHSWGLLVVMTPLLVLYTLLSDATAPAVRASIMGIGMLLALRLLRYRDPLTLIALAAAALLIANPYNLWQIGFQLSFLAMLGLVCLTPRFLPFLKRLPDGLASAIATSLAAECVSLPLVAWYFYQVAPLSTIMNLLVVPFFSLLVPLSLIALLIAGFIPALGGLVFLPVRAIILVVVALMDIVNAFTGTLHIYIGQPAVWLIVLFYTLLILFCLVPQHAHRQRTASLGILCLMLAVIILRPAVPNSLRLTMVDVGQGSGAVYQSADGDWLVFDTGPGADTMAQYLRYCGANEIAAIVLSHSDSDHIGGLPHILRDFRVKRLFASPAAQKSEEWAALIPYLDETEIVTIDGPATYESGSLRLDCTLTAPAAEASENANQVASRLSDARFSALFPGDTDADALSEIPWQEATDVVIVPHHGSKNSWDAAFYERLTPDLALISAGVDNRYGHPSPETTDGLAALGIPTACTAQDGAIRLYARDGQLWMDRFLS